MATQVEIDEFKAVMEKLCEAVDGARLAAAMCGLTNVTAISILAGAKLHPLGERGPAVRSIFALFVAQLAEKLEIGHEHDRDPSERQH